jgi:hypothetical protein
MRNVLSVTVALFLFAGFPASAAVKQPVSKCPKKLADCPNDGCSTEHAVDGGLNERKNITDDDDEAHGLAAPMTLRAIKDLPDPQDFAMGGAGFGVDALTGAMWQLEPAKVERKLAPIVVPEVSYPQPAGPL